MLQLLMNTCVSTCHQGNTVIVICGFVFVLAAIRIAVRMKELF